LNAYDDLFILCDKEKLFEVFNHLILNAIKFTPPKGKVLINSKKNNNTFEIKVKDTGLGITQQEKKRLFKQFGKIERYGKGWDVDIEGSGLGLYICKKIVELHGGEIWVESGGRDKGSTFKFTLPLTGIEKIDIFNN
jgi:signal transduction histidine kinase